MSIIGQIKSHFDNALNLNSYIILGSRLLGPGGSFLFWVLAARLMAPVDIGLATGAIASAGLLAGMAQLGIGYGLMRYLPGSKHPKELINSGIEIVSGSALIFGIVYLLGLQLWSPALISLQENLWMVLCFLTLLLSYAINQLLNWIFLSKRKPIFALIQSAVQTFLSIILLVVLSQKGLTYGAPILAYMLSLAISCGITIFFFLPIQQPGYRLNLTLPARVSTKFMGYSLVNFLADLLQRAPDTLMILLVLNLLGPEIGAYFFAAWTVANGLLNLAGSVSPSLLAEGMNQPWMSVTYTQKALKLGFVYALSLSATAVVFSRLILSMYGSAYLENGWGLFVLLVISIIPGIVPPIFSNFLRIQDKLNWLTIFSGLSLIFGIFFAQLFIGLYGLVGAGVGWLISRLLLMILMIIFWELKKSSFRKPLGAIQPNKF